MTYFRPYTKIPSCIVVGAEGLIGKALVNVWHPSISTDQKTLDLSSPSLDTLPIKNETHLIIAAGKTKPASCENDPTKTREVNVEGTLRLAKLAAQRAITPILFSTDYVFDGSLGVYSETSPHSPLNEYGKQKSLLEKEIADATQGNYLLLRLSKIYTTNPHDQTLLNEIFSNLQKKSPFLAATDQIFNPLHIDDLIAIIASLIEEKKTGLYNVGGKEAVSRFDLAKKICQALELPENKISPVSIDHFGKNLRPKKTVLDTGKLYSEIDIAPLPLSERILQRMIL